MHQLNMNVFASLNVYEKNFFQWSFCYDMRWKRFWQEFQNELKEVDAVLVLMLTERTALILTYLYASVHYATTMQSKLRLGTYFVLSLMLKFLANLPINTLRSISLLRSSCSFSLKIASLHFLNRIWKRKKAVA